MGLAFKKDIAGGRTKLGMDGDSQFGLGANQLSITSATQTAGIATFTIAASHSLAPGQKVRTYGIADPKWVREFTVSTVTGLATFTAAIDPTAAATAVTSGIPAGMMIFSKHLSNERTALSVMAALNGVRFDIVNTGVGGRTTPECLADMDISQFRGCFAVVLETCSNDAKNGVTVEQTVAAQLERIKRVRSIGAVPILTTTIPYGLTYLASSGVNMAITQAMRELARVEDIPLWDLYDIMVDRTSTHGYAKSGYLFSDNIHVTAAAWHAAAPSLWAIISKLTSPRLAELCSSILDVTNAASTQFCQNGQMSGTGGTTVASVSGGVDGANMVVPDAWSVAKAGSWDTINTEKASGRFGATNATKISFKSAATNSDFYLRSASFHAALTAGKVVSAACRIVCDIQDTCRILVGLKVRPTGDSVDSYFYLMHNSSSISYNAQGQYTLDLSTFAPWVLPEGFTCTSAILEIRILGVGAAANVSTITVDSPAVYAR